MYLAVFLLSKQPEVLTIEKERVNELQVPTFSVPLGGRTAPADTLWPGPSATPSSVPKMPSRHHFPHRRFSEVECGSTACRFVAQWLRSTITTTSDPCTDFYRYVCGSFRGRDHATHLILETEFLSVKFLAEKRVPPSNQTVADKVAGLYQTCMAFAESHDTETSLLVEWMVSLNLDLGDERKLARVDPVDMIVRCSLDLGVPAILSFELHNAKFYANKREMKVRK
ncbi:hypothetical protein MRX96_042587 [Rhipicephalus microplus]